MLTPAQVANDPELFASIFLKILDKDKRLVPFRWNKAQQHFHANRTGRDLILKARQLGFSTYIQGEMFRRTVTNTRTTMTMAHDDETTQKLRRIVDRFYEHCKFNNIQPERRYANSTLASYPEFDSEAVIATAGSKEAGRGGTYTDFHGSEVAFWKDAEKIMAGAMEGGNPDVILESTPNGTQGWFYDRCLECLDGDSEWKLHFYPWWWDAAYRIPLHKGEVIKFTDEEKFLIKKHGLDAEQIKWRRKKKKSLKRFFPQEYPEDPRTCFLNSGSSYFGDLSIPFEEIFTAPMDAEYNPDHKYCAGLDFGQQLDWLSLSVGDQNAKEQVDLLHINQLSWGEMRERVKDKFEQWHLEYILAEENSIGGVNIEALRDMGVIIIPFDTTNKSKAAVMQQYHEHLDDGWKLQPYDVQKQEHQIFTSSQTATGLWRLAAAGSGHDDTVISGALMIEALYCALWLIS